MIKRRHALFFMLGCLAVVTFLTFSGFFTVNILKMNGSQFTLSLIIFTTSIVIGLAWKLILDFQQAEGNITWAELAIGGLVVGLLFSAVGVNIGWKIAVNNTTRYNEYWNGWELQTLRQDFACTEDGPCIHEYSCDPYLVPYEVCSTDSEGHESCNTYYRVEYHDCPYATVESTYVVKTTLGDYTIDNHVFTLSPAEWRTGNHIPASVQRGPSLFWLGAKDRIDSGYPGPVTKRNSYDNYILASDTTIFKQYSSQIDAYKAAGVLPDLRRDVRNFYQADKVYFVGFTPTNAPTWQKAHSYLNAAFGTELQGDLHLVIVQSDLVSVNPDAYIIALKAYWQGPDYGKDAISKNSVIVVLGTKDGSTIAWSRAATGMPIGNEAMLTAIRNHMAGMQLTPEAVLGAVNGQFYQKVKSDGTTKLAVEGIGDTGALRRIFWGLDDLATKFARVSMSANDTSDNGNGFAYLKDQIRPSFGQQLTIVLVFLFLSVILWGAEAYFVGELRY